MAATHRFIADPAESSEVLAWFRTLPSPPEETRTENGCILYFRDCGPLAYDAQGRIDSNASPVVNIFLPQVRRGVLWSVGEIHFLSTHLRTQFPALHKVNVAFSKWLAKLPCVFSTKSEDNEFAYCFEGSIRNRDAPVYAFNSGLNALQSGRYFVAHDDSEHRLNIVCQTLRLRGLECPSTEQDT